VATILINNKNGIEKIILNMQELFGKEKVIVPNDLPAIVVI
jgi:hypothetical protein